MDKRSHPPQFVPAQPGWLALFEDATDGRAPVRAEPVIAWRFGGCDGSDFAHGQAIVGASPWLEKADKEDAQHYFALVREEQLEPDFLAELKANKIHRRDDVMRQAERCRRDRSVGHESWVRERRAFRVHAREVSPLRIF